MRPEPIIYGDRRVYTVAGFAAGISSWLAKLPALWVEGEIVEIRRQDHWTTVFISLRDTADEASLAVTIQRRAFDALALDLEAGERVHVHGRPELYRARGQFQLRATMIERLGAGDLAASLERLRRTLAAEGLFDAERKRALPRIPRTIGVVTGVNAAAKHDIITAVTTRFPAARLLVGETTVQGPRAPETITAALRAVEARENVDVIVLTRGGGSFEDLLPFSDERVVRAVAACRVPVVSAVGHEHDTPFCDLAADVRASTPTAAARLLVPDHRELFDRLASLRIDGRKGIRGAVAGRRERLAENARRLARGPIVVVERARARLDHQRHRGRTMLERQVPVRRDAADVLAQRLRALSPEATLRRGYAIVRAESRLVTEADAVSPGAAIDVTLARGRLAATVVDVEPAPANRLSGHPEEDDG